MNTDNIAHIALTILLGLLVLPAIFLLAIGLLRWSGAAGPKWLTAGPVLCALGMGLFAVATARLSLIAAAGFALAMLALLVCTPQMRKAFGFPGQAPLAVPVDPPPTPPRRR